MSRYEVIGGIYADTDFKRLVEDEIREGPFPDYHEAYKAWARLSWQYVDQCNARFRIEECSIGFTVRGSDRNRGPYDRRSAELVCLTLRFAHPEHQYEVEEIHA